MFVEALLEWYELTKREMPWRTYSTPYHVWISEIMLQQTQVDTAIPYFNRFITAFPTVEALSRADLQQVLKLWEGLGYYSRARNLHKAANLLINEYDGCLPTTYKEIQNIPGIGPYCAAAITSISFGVPVPVVDGNVFRVFTRYWGIFDDIRRPKVRELLFDRLTPFIEDSGDPSSFNQGIMELGALICKPSSPKCSDCPISSSCYAFLNDKTAKLPVKSKLPPVPHYDIGVGIIIKDDQVLIGKRKASQMLGGLWEFPGGKRQKNEPIHETIHREVCEETALKVAVDSEYAVVKHAYSHFKITLHAYLCTFVSGEPIPHSTEQLLWVPIQDLSSYPFPKANKVLVEKLTRIKT